MGSQTIICHSVVTLVRERAECDDGLLQTKTFETRAEAEQWARAIEVEMAKGVFVSRAEAESTTLRELLERYLEEVTPPSVARFGSKLKYIFAVCKS